LASKIDVGAGFFGDFKGEKAWEEGNVDRSTRRPLGIRSMLLSEVAVVG
jgi:hypothetical protein